MKSGVALVDVIAGQDAAIAILAALAGRDRGAQRQLTISLAESARAALVNVAQNALVSRRDAMRWGNAHANLVPYQLFDASDRAIVIAVGNDAQWVACAEALGLPGLARDPGLSTNRGRLARREFVAAEISRVVAQHPASHWMERLERAGVPSGVVKGVLEVISETAGSSLTGMPSSIGGTVRIPPPRLDENGGQIRSLGWGAFPGYR